MAQLDQQPEGAPSKIRQGGLPDIPAGTQLLAIAWLRWRIFANGFRRQAGKRQAVGLVLTIVLRLLIWPIFAAMALGPTLGAGYFAWNAISGHHPSQLIPLLAVVAILWQFVAVNGAGIAASVSSFDPASLLRFPLRFGRYLVLRLLLGLLTPSTIIGCLALFAAAIGIAIANVRLAPAAFLVLAVYAAMNLFFSRMIGVWLERALSTRRAREIFGAVMALFFISFQFLNIHRPAHHARAAATDSWIMNLLYGTNRVLAWLPPGFAANSILPGHPLVRLGEFLALVAVTALFFAAFAARLHKQFLGEYLSEGAPRATPSPRQPAPAAAARAPTENVQRATYNLLSPTIEACLRKEWVYLRGNGNQIIAMLTPLVFVFLLSRGILARHPSYLLAGAVGYALLGLLAALYNIFGADSTGVQLYLLAPVRLRDVIVAKNIAGMTLLLVEATLAWCLAEYLATVPIPLATQISTAFWVIFMLFANLTLGTLRSIQAPRKITLAQTRRLRQTTASKTSGLLVLAILLGSILLQIPVTLLCRHFHNAWLAVWIFAPLAAAAVAAYGLLLNHADRLILTYRDRFAEELCGD